RANIRAVRIAEIDQAEFSAKIPVAARNSVLVHQHKRSANIRGTVNLNVTWCGFVAQMPEQAAAYGGKRHEIRQESNRRTDHRDLAPRRAFAGLIECSGNRKRRMNA